MFWRLATGRTWSPALPATGALVALLLLLAGHSAAAANDQMIGFDMKPQGVGVASLGTIDPCVQVNVGDQFVADVFVVNVTGLTAFEFRIDYDPEIVSLDSADFNAFLTSTRSEDKLLGKTFVSERPDRVFLAAGETQAPDNGSGVLAHVHMTALKKGTSRLTIPSQPMFAPLLQGLSNYIGDTNGDKKWDGQLSSGTVSVGQPCGASTPVATPPPTPKPTPTPLVSPGDNPGGPSAPPSSPLVAAQSPGSGDGQPGDGQPGDGHSANGPGENGAPNNGTGGNNGSSAPGAAQPGGGGATGTLLIVAAAVLLCTGLAAGGWLLLTRRRAER